jgi:hypothetical protein
LTPTGVGPNRKTIIRIVTPTPTAGVTFEITPPAGKTATRIVVDGATGAIEVQGTGVPVTSNVIAEVISDAPDNAPVAPNFALVRVTIDYAPNFDFGGVAETWTLKVKEMPTERRYMGFIATATNETDTLVTRPKMHIEGSE